MQILGGDLAGVVEAVDAGGKVRHSQTHHMLPCIHSVLVELEKCFGVHAEQ